MTTPLTPSATTLTTLVNAAPAASAQSLIEESQVQPLVYQQSSEALIPPTTASQTVVQPQSLEVNEGLGQIPKEAEQVTGQTLDDERNNQKPPYTYTELITQALKDQTALTVSGIYNWIT